MRRGVQAARRRPAQAFLFVVAVVVAALAAAPAQAEPADGLRLRVRADQPLAPVLVLTNSGAAPCQIATTSLGTVGVNRVEQAGSPVAPIGFDVGFDDGAGRFILGRLRTLDPGGSVEIPLHVVSFGPTGHAIETVAWSAAGASLGQLHPIRPDGALRFEATYSLPVALQNGPPACGMALGTTSDRAGSDRKDLLPLTLLAGAGLVGLLLVGVVIVLIRRRRRAGAAAVTIVLLVAGLLGVDWSAAHPAAAKIAVDPSLEQAWAGCSATLHGPGGDPAGILPTLEGPNVRVDIVPSGGDITHEGALSRDHIIVQWDPDDRHKYVGNGGNADPCTTLYHELYHAYEDARGGQDHTPCVTADGPSGLPTAEVMATRAQNKLRAKLGMPERDHYGDIPLPKGDCLPRDKQPNPPQCTGNGCGDSNGDPHLVTFDGRRYDFQAVGEFVAVRDPAGGLQIQVRQQPASPARIASINTAVAMDVAGDRIEVRMAGVSGLMMVLNGQSTPLTPQRLPHGGAVAISAGYTGPLTAVTWPDGSVVALTPIGHHGIHLTAQPAPARSGHLEGLLGNFDGDQGNDIRPRGGDPIADPTFDRLYPSFADSWRIGVDASLFTYEPGSGTQTYTDRTFPDRPPALADLPNHDVAETLCRRLGVTEPQALAACTFDVAVTGQPDFALAALAGQQFLGGLRIDGPEVTATIAQAGDTVRMSFLGTAGQKIYVQLLASTLPDQCGVIALRGPDDRALAEGCTIHGTGQIDATVLPTTGRYTVVIDPRGAGTGEVRLRVVTASDFSGGLTPGGPEVTATIGQPGAVARLTFDGTAGQRVFVDVPSSTLPDQCDVLSLLTPAGAPLVGGCIINGAGFIDGTLLPATGRYTVVVDPLNERTGQARLRLYATTDRQSTATVNGSPVMATVDQPGAVVRFGFAGAAGQQVTVEVLSSTLPDQCGVLSVSGPDGKPISSGCVVNGAGHFTAALPDDGPYTLSLDPQSRATGTTQLRLRT